jgi:hypothetical protein
MRSKALYLLARVGTPPATIAGQTFNQDIPGQIVDARLENADLLQPGKASLDQRGPAQTFSLSMVVPSA